MLISLRESVYIFVGISFVLSRSLGEIIADPNSNKANQPLILNSPNSTTIINIVTPNEKGISFNEYIKFNTTESGTVLNNLVNGANTLISGFVEANPFLNSGSASLIVNQINSNDPSLLGGNLEIAGKRADILIANPSGISINGLNIINVNSSTFTTAKLENTSGNLSLNLNPNLLLNPTEKLSGTIIIEGNGLNDKSSNYTNIIANTINLLSNIHSNELNLVSTDNKVVTTNKLFDTVMKDADISNLSIAKASIDSSNLGGMYANKINIIATKDGVGVNNAGIINANYIKIDSSGDIINLNTIKSNKNADIRSKNIISNKNRAIIASGGDMQLSSKQIDNINSSNIVSFNNLTLKADKINNASSNILADYINIKADSLNNYSLSKFDIKMDHFSSTLNLLCCGDRSFKLSVDIGKIKEEIKKEWDLAAKSYTSYELNDELYKRVVSQDANAYALNLHKSSYLHGTGSNPFSSIRLDESSNSIIVNVSYVKDHEKTRNIYYNMVKEYIAKESLESFMPSRIYASSDIKFETNTIMNDKSQIYAGRDIAIKTGSINNIGQDLDRSVSSYIKYEWEQEEWRKGGKITGRKKWVAKGGDSAHQNYNYQENGYPAIFAANNGFYADAINLNNGDIDELSNKTINIPIFKPNNIVHINFKPINTGFLYGMDGSSPNFMLNKFDSLYINAQYLLNDNLNSLKSYGSIDRSSIILAKNTINIDASGSIFNSGTLVSNSINLNSNSIKDKEGLILADQDINLKANSDIALSSSSLTADNINLNADRLIINQTSQKNIVQDGLRVALGSSSNLNSKSDINLNASNVLISGANLHAANNLNADIKGDMVIDASKQEYSFNIDGKDTNFKGDIISHQVSSIDAKNINISADNINIIGSNLNADESINLKADKNIEISSINDEAQLASTVRSKGFLSKKQTTTQSIRQDSISSNLNSKNINLSSNEDATIAGSNLNAKDSIEISSRNINLTPTTYADQEYSHTTKSGFGGFKKSLDINLLAKQKLRSSSLSTESGNIILNANNDINIVSSDISSGGMLNLNANNSINILVAKEQVKELSIHKKSSFNPISALTYPGMLIGSIIDPLSNGVQTFASEKVFGDKLTQIYKAQYNEKGSIDHLSKLSNISANDGINFKADSVIITSNLSSKNDVNINANQASILNATNDRTEYFISKSKKVSIADMNNILKDAKPKSISELKKDTSVKVKLANATYEKVTKNISSSKVVSSNIDSKNLNILTDEDITITASNLNASDDITLRSKNGNIYISNSSDTIDTSSTLKQAELAISFTAQNEYAQMVPAVIALQDAIKQLNSVRKEYEAYKEQKSNLISKLNELKQRYKNKEAGIDYSDIEDLTDIIDNVKDEERYFVANIALATTNVAFKTTALISQTASAASSSATYGFSVGVSAEARGLDSKSSAKETRSVASNLNANNILISTDKDKDGSTNITGSNLIANNNININTDNLNITSSSDTYEADEKTKDLSGSIKFTMYGGGGGSAGLNYSLNHSDEHRVTHNNSNLYSKNNIDITVSNDTTIKGANLRADNTLNLNTNNLTLESVRDSYTSKQKGYSISGDIGFGGQTKAQSNNTPANGPLDTNHFTNTSSIKTSNLNSNLAQNRSNAITKQTVLSSITANKLNINAKNNTHLKGSLIAAGEYDDNGNFIDNGNLNLKTNTLTYENLSNTSYTKATALSIGANYAFEDNDNKSDSTDNANDTKGNDQDLNSKISSVNVSNSRNIAYSTTKTLATIGQGNLVIKDQENSDDLARLNRDVSDINKELYFSTINSNIDASIDTRFFTKEGREEIKRDYENVNPNMLAIAKTLPNENSDNKAESAAGYIWNTITKWITLGMIPSYENKGGILAQIPVLTGSSDHAVKQFLVVNEISDKFKENEGEFMRFEDSEFFKMLNKKDRQDIANSGFLDTLYISKKPVEITEKTATSQNFTNGIMNNEGEAIKNALSQTGFYKSNGIVEVTVNYNPSYGFISDLLESGVDKFGGTTGIAKQTGEFMDKVVSARKDKDTNFANHSQANALANSALRWMSKNNTLNSLSPNNKDTSKGKVTLVSFGSPINHKEMRETLEKTNIEYSGSYTKSGDYVGEGIGGNKGENGDATILDKVNLKNAGKLITSNSPHSLYICQDYSKLNSEEGVRCGYLGE
ncbi:hemagglutinin repeat-containing protein [Campylobacter sp. MOP51]|uniref:two-partner secretion domain-containing protein n=1 Tax=Campylobacter canis TaxID=3378588 RepID=UPI003C4C066B